MPDQFPPPREADLLAFSTNFSELITNTPTVYGLSAAQATVYSALHLAFADAYSTITKPATRTKPKITAKDDAKAALLDNPGGLRQLAAIIQAFPGTTNEMREDLGLPVYDSVPTPTPAPTTAPALSVLSQSGRAVKIRLRDAENPDTRAKPAGVIGASILMWVGEVTPPQDPLEWTFLLNTSKTLVEIDFPAAVASGAKVWLTAFWFNRKQQSSLAAAYQSVRVGDALAQTA